MRLSRRSLTSAIAAALIAVAVTAPGCARRKEQPVRDAHAADSVHCAALDSARLYTIDSLERYCEEQGWQLRRARVVVRDTLIIRLHYHEDNLFPYVVADTLRTSHRRSGL